MISMFRNTILYPFLIGQKSFTSNINRRMSDKSGLKSYIYEEFNYWCLAEND